MNKLKEVIKQKIKNASKNRGEYEEKVIKKLEEFMELSELNQLDLEMMNKFNIIVPLGKFNLAALPLDMKVINPKYKYGLIPHLQGVEIEPEDYPDAINALEEFLSGIEVGKL